MARKKARTLTDAELKLMEVLWQKDRATVSEVVDSLQDNLAYNTVLTTLRILESKGHVQHEKEGRAFVYRPLIERAKAQEHATAHLLDRFFGNSPELLVLNLIKDEKIDSSTLKALMKRIEEEL